jgi:hypothetical protein
MGIGMVVSIVGLCIIISQLLVSQFGWGSVPGFGLVIVGSIWMAIVGKVKEWDD